MPEPSVKSAAELSEELAQLDQRLRACEKLLYRITEICRTSSHFEDLRERTTSMYTYWEGYFPGSYY
jgi:hypothetical protein